MTTALAAAALCFAPFAVRASPERLALIVEDRSGSAGASAQIAALATALLAHRGYQASPEEAAGPVLALTIEFYLGGEARLLGPRASPAIGLSAALIANHRVVWRNSVGLIVDAPAPAATESGDANKPPAELACKRLFLTFPNSKSSPPNLAMIEADDPDHEATLMWQAAKVSLLIPRYDVPFGRRPQLRSGPRFRIRMDRANPRPGRPAEKPQVTP